MAINPGVMAASPGFFLDSFTGVKGAYSLRRISGAEISVVRVRRDSDDTEADFTSAEIDSGALVIWVGAGNDGFVAKIYDQSGNDNDAVQTNTSYQAKVISSGSLVTSGGLAAWDHATQSNLEIDGLSNTAFVDAWYLAETSDTTYLYPGNGASGSDYGFVSTSGSTSTSRQSDYGSASLYADGTLISHSTRDDVYDALNGRKLIHHQSASISSWNDFQVGRYGTASSGNTYNYAGKFQVILVFDSDQSGNRAAIDASLNSYYEVY